MKSVVCASLAALLLAILVLPSLTSAANDGPSASGNFQFTLDEAGQARSLEFHARVQNNGRTVGEMTFSDPAAVPVSDPDDPGAIANTGTIITAKFDCLQITGKQAVMSGPRRIANCELRNCELRECAIAKMRDLVTA